MPSITTAEAFDELDENLKLDPDERRGAEELHNEITEILKKAGLIVLAFLQGSFARKTMIAPLRDIDKVVVLAPSMKGLSPDEVMTRIQNVLSAHYPDAVFERSRHALKIDFGEATFYFDTVPAWETTTDDDDDVLIANRDTGGWDRSNTRELIRTIAERNQETGGFFIHEVRMGKQAIANLLDGIIPGLHVESWAYDVIEQALPHDEAVARIIEAGAGLLGGPYYEPTGVDMISTRLKPDVIAVAKPVLEKAARDARTAVELAAAGDHNGAIAVWHQIFGNEFPAPAAEGEEATLRRAFSGASVTPAGTVSTSRVGRQTAQPVRPWRSL
jgi:predicted nucleotidyltransferase